MKWNYHAHGIRINRSTRTQQRRHKAKKADMTNIKVQRSLTGDYLCISLYCLAVAVGLYGAQFIFCFWAG